MDVEESNQQNPSPPSNKHLNMASIISSRKKPVKFKEDRDVQCKNESFFTKDISKVEIAKRRRKKPLKWSEQDTNTFYRCLEVFGTDFSMMAEVLSHKTQRQLLRKYHKEKKRDLVRVNGALERHESNLIKRDSRAKSFLEGVFKLTSESELSAGEFSDNSFENVVAKKLKLLAEVGKDSEGEDIKPLSFYLNQLD